MNLLRLVDLGNGQIQVSWQRGIAAPRLSPELLPFGDPLSPQDRAELRWYLEDYLQFPYGAEKDRAAAVATKLEEWGEALFRQVFPKTQADPDPRYLYDQAVGEDLDHCELCIASDDPTFLNIPWELIRDPVAGRGFLAPLLAGLYRQRSSFQPLLNPNPESASQFRVLLVIARPYGQRDVPLGTVARGILDALRPFGDRARVDLLRPPSFDALQRHVGERPGYYHVVHFDGHGVFANALNPAMFR